MTVSLWIRETVGGKRHFVKPNKKKIYPDGVPCKDNFTQLERFFAAKIARIEAPASGDAGKPIAWKVPPFQPIE
jgi:hypothetical protein